MTDHRLRHPGFRLGAALRPWVAAVAAVVAISTTTTVAETVFGPGAAFAADSPPTQPNQPSQPSAAALQVKAQELAGQLDADGRRLDELDGAYNAALIRYHQLQAQQTQLKAQVTAASARLAVARQAMKEQAIIAYMAGGAPLISYLPGRAVDDPSLTVSYAQIVTGGQKRTTDEYRQALAGEQQKAAALTATEQSAAVTLSDVNADRSQAMATLAAQKKSLAEVNGQLAVLVAQVRAQRQQAEQAAVEASLAARHQLPGQAPPAAPTGLDAVRRAAPATTAAPATPAPTTSSHTAIGATTTTTALRTGTHPSTTTSTTTPPTTSPTKTNSSNTNSGNANSGNTNSPTNSNNSGPNVSAPGSDTAIAYARAQLGKPYQWGGAGPDSFDCSGLVMMAWEQAGVYFPHLAQDQYDMTKRIGIADLQPGDLVFFGTPDNVYHVGIYIGNGQMIDAPETGQDVSIQSIYWDSLLGGGRIQS